MSDETKQGATLAPELTPKQFRAAFQIAVSTYYEWRAAGIIPAPIHYSPRCVRHPQSHLDEFRAKAAAGQLPKVDRAAVRAQRRAARAAQVATNPTP